MMNERIQQLYDTALVAAGKENQFETTHLDVAEKFAELILQECCLVIDKHYEPVYDGKLIKRYFGVE
jgi:hypothetical protein